MGLSNICLYIVQITWKCFHGGSWTVACACVCFFYCIRFLSWYLLMSVHDQVQEIFTIPLVSLSVSIFGHGLGRLNLSLPPFPGFPFFHWHMSMSADTRHLLPSSQASVTVHPGRHAEMVVLYNVFSFQKKKLLIHSLGYSPSYQDITGSILHNRIKTNSSEIRRSNPYYRTTCCNPGGNQTKLMNLHSLWKAIYPQWGW